MKIKLKTFGFSLMTLILFSCNDSDDVAKKQVSCLPTNLQSGVIAFYPFNSGSINDFSGNNYNLTNTTSASSGSDRAGNTNCAFHFNAANSDFLKYTNPTFVDNFQTLSFSISLWYKNETSTAGNYELLIGRDSNLRCPNTSGQWSVGLYDNRKPVFGINDSDLWWNIGSDVTPTIWRHLVVTCVGTNLKLYLDGVLTSETISTGGCATSNPTINFGDLFLGKEFTGFLDDVIIYNRILTQSEISELKGLTPCCQ